MPLVGGFKLELSGLLLEGLRLGLSLNSAGSLLLSLSVGLD